MNTENIQRFLQTAFTDERLTALLAHAENGSLSFTSCCCLVGSARSDHALMSAGQYCDNYGHLHEARRLPFADAAEDEFNLLGCADDGRRFDALRRERIIPLIRDEITRRENECSQSTANILDSRDAVEV